MNVRRFSRCISHVNSENRLHAKCWLEQFNTLQSWYVCSHGTDEVTAGIMSWYVLGHGMQKSHGMYEVTVSIQIQQVCSHGMYQ